MATREPYRKLSGSTDGKNIPITTVATLGDVIHASVAGTEKFDEVTLYVNNIDTVTRTITVEWGGAGAAHQHIQKVPPKQGDFLLIPNLRLSNGLSVTAFADVANVLNVNGIADLVTP
jgi:hypothetical protein